MHPVVVAISVGGTKLQIAVASALEPVLLADSGRVEWARGGHASLQTLLGFVAREVPGLLSTAGVGAEAVARVGVAWPGPVIDGRVEATFIGGCEGRPRLADHLRRALFAVLGPAVEHLPVAVELDAYARACGECVAGKAFTSAGSGLLINQATGIAGALVVGGGPLRSHAVHGPAYGQFGRFLLRDVECSAWHWSPTPDGSIPPEPAGRVRWTRWGGGPALAARAAAWCRSHGCMPVDPPTRSAVIACSGGGRRDVAVERAVLGFVSDQWHAVPGGEAAAFVRLVAGELGTAIDKLAEVLTAQPLDCVVLAGGVGECFAAPPRGQRDTWLDTVRSATTQAHFRIGRSVLGVQAELLGFCDRPDGVAAWAEEE